MLNILKLLKTSNIISQYHILDFKQENDFFYFKILINLTNNSELHVKEYSSSIERNYSYHWQDKEKNLVVRWDNAPHHKDLKTAPHHKHTPILEESFEISLEDVLAFIEKRIDETK